MLREVGYIIGFTFATIASIAHIFGFALLYHWKTKLVNQRIILINFSVCALINCILHTTRGVYSYAYKHHLHKIAKFYLYTNGLFIGVELYYTLLMFLLTLDRLIITVQPYRYEKIFPRQRCKTVLITFFVSSVVPSIIFLVLQDRSAHITAYKVSLAFLCLLSLFNLVSYTFIFYIINEREKKVLPRKPVRKRRKDIRKVVTPLLINITLIIFFIAPHTATIKSLKKLNYFEISCITMDTVNAGLIIDALVYIVNTNARKLLNKSTKKFKINF